MMKTLNDTLCYMRTAVFKEKINFIRKYCDFLRYLVSRYVDHFHHLFSGQEPWKVLYFTLYVVKNEKYFISRFRLSK